MGAVQPGAPGLRPPRARQPWKVAVVATAVAAIVLAGVGFYWVGSHAGPAPLRAEVLFSERPLSHCNTTSAGNPANTTFNVYPLVINSTTAPFTTSNFFPIVTGLGTVLNSGPVSVVGTGTCPGANPKTLFFWTLVIEASGGAPLAAYAGGGGNTTGSANWVPLGGTPLPVAIAPTMTFVFLDSGSLEFAMLSLQGLGGATVQGGGDFP